MIEPRPTLIVVAGPNGSGKTSLTTKVLQHKWVDGCVYINPDNIAKEVYGDWNSPTAVIEAAKHAEAMREDCLSQKKSMAFESVLSAGDKVDFIRRAKDAGYFIRLFFVGTSHPSINASRVARRVMEGGHDVPIPKIISRYTKSIVNCAAVAAFADRSYIYDNSVDDKPSRLLFRTEHGAVVKTYDSTPDWARLIEQSLPRGKPPTTDSEHDASGYQPTP